VTAVAPATPAATAELLRRARRQRALRRNLTAFAFLTPSLCFFCAFMVVPVVWVVRQSFMEGGVLGPARWVGVSNWSQALRDPTLTHALLNTVKYTVMVVPVTIVLALALALLLRGVRHGGAALRTVLYLPSLAPIVLAALIWVFMVQPDFGLLNLANRALGLQPLNLLGDENLALPTIAGLDVWRGVGFWGVLLLAGLLGVPRELYQAAELDGASPARRFWHVTLPGLRPVLSFVTMVTIIASANMFGQSYLMTQGQPGTETRTAIYQIAETGLRNYQMGSAAAMSYVLTIVLMLLSVLVFRLFREREAR
jgi:multiple sugar transport system permease protein